MRRIAGQALRIGVSSQAVCLLRSNRWRGEKLTVLAEQPCAPEMEDRLAAIGQALELLLQGGAYAGWPVSFVLDDEWCRLWPVALPQGATRLADIEAAAAMRFQMLYGSSPVDWKISAGWDAGAPFFAAVPRALLALLEHSAARHQLNVVAIAPHFVMAWNRWQGALKPGAWYGLVHRQLLTIGALDGGGLRAVRALPVPHGAEYDWLTQVLLREALLLDMAPPAQMQLSGQAPAAWAKPAAEGALAVALLDAAQRAGGAMSPPAMLAACGSGA